MSEPNKESVTASASIQKLLQPILDQAGAASPELVSKLRTEITKLKAQLEREKQQTRTAQEELKLSQNTASTASAQLTEAKNEAADLRSEKASLQEDLMNYQDSESDLIRERDDARAELNRVRAQLRTFGAETEVLNKEDIRALIAQAEVDFTELKMEVDIWTNANLEDVTMDQKELALNTAMHLAGMFQCMRVAAELWEDNELACAQAKIDEADRYAGVVRASLMGLRLGWRYIDSLRKIVQLSRDEGLLEDSDGEFFEAVNSADKLLSGLRLPYNMVTGLDEDEEDEEEGYYEADGYEPDYEEDSDY